MSEASVARIEELGRHVAEAIAHGELDWARELTEEGIRRQAAAAAAHDPVGGVGE